MSETETAELRSRAELERIIETRSEQVRETVADAGHERRDLSDMEAETIRSHRAEVDEAKGELRTVEARERAQLVQQELSRMRGGAVETRQAAQTLVDFDTGLREGVPQRKMVDAELFTRAADTSTTGGTVEVAARTGRPAFIWSVLGVPMFPASANTVEGPTWQPLTSQTPTGEGSAKPAMTDSVLDSQQLGAYAVTHTVSDRVVRYGIGGDAVGARLAAEAVFSVNGGVIDRLENHGTELGFNQDVTTSLDTAIAEVVARTGGATGIIINPAEYPAIAARAATSAEDVQSGTVSGYNGLRLFMHPSMAAGSGIVVNGAWLSAHSSDVLMASLPLLDTNEVQLRAEVYAAVLVGDASAVQRVALASA